MYSHTEKMFDALLGSLSDPSDDVVRQSLAVLAEICSTSFNVSSTGSIKNWNCILYNILNNDFSLF